MRGASPRGCFPTTEFEELLPEWITMWKAFSELHWGGTDETRHLQSHCWLAFMGILEEDRPAAKAQNETLRSINHYGRRSGSTGPDTMPRVV